MAFRRDHVAMAFASRAQLMPPAVRALLVDDVDPATIPVKLLIEELHEQLACVRVSCRNTDVYDTLVDTLSSPRKEQPTLARSCSHFPTCV